MLHRRRRPPRVIVPIILTVLAGWLLWHGAVALLAGGSSTGAEAAVRKFYILEQEGNFGGSWELFHSDMKQHFAKDSYIQKRAHVFMQDFEVNTFGFKLGNSEKIGAWRMASEGELLQNVYAIPVTMEYESKFGVFEINQLVYACQEAGKWRLLWDYGGRIG